jgi:predicted ester cyclase
MSPIENKKLIRRFYDEAINRHDAAAAAEFYAVDAKNHGRLVGRSGMKAVFDTLFSTFPDFTYRIDEITAEHDRVLCRVTMRGTHLGRPILSHAFGGMLHGVAPTGKRVEVLQFHSFRIDGAQICEHAAVRDDLGMLIQLGLAQRPS